MSRSRRQAWRPDLHAMSAMHYGSDVADELSWTKDCPVTVACDDDCFHAFHVFVGRSEEAIEQWIRDEPFEQALWWADRHRRGPGIVRLVGVPPNILKMLELSRLPPALEVYESVRDALV